MLLLEFWQKQKGPPGEWPHPTIREEEEDDDEKIDG